MKYLGIDYGDRKIGLAIGDDESFVASPFAIIENGDLILDEIQAIADTNEIDKIVIGIPMRMMQERPAQYNKVANFIVKLKEGVDKEVIIEDESFSTQLAGRLIQEDKMAKEDDDTAAMIVLQSFFDRLRNKSLKE